MVRRSAIRDRDPLLVLWKRGDSFSTEADPPEVVEWQWTSPTIYAFELFRAPQQVEHRDGVARLAVSITPTLISAAWQG